MCDLNDIAYSDGSSGNYCHLCSPSGLFSNFSLVFVFKLRHGEIVVGQRFYGVSVSWPEGTGKQINSPGRFGSNQP